MSKSERVVVMGASNKPERYSYKAIALLKENGHEAIPVHPALREVQGIPVVDRIENVAGPIDTVTLYIGPERTEELADAIAAAKPRRVIANPGAESEAMRKKAEAAGIQYLEACTLVLLRTGQY